MNEDRTKRKLTAIFSADVVGYSRLMEEDEAWTIQSLRENKRLLSKLIEEYDGRVIDAPGDNLLAEFNSVINAVESAVRIQQELKKKNDALIESRRMRFRIGVNLGDVVEEDGRIYGDGVNIAARLEGLTDPGGICISRRTYDHVKTRLGLGYEYLGEHIVKNISEPVRVYRVLMGSENAGKVIGEKKASKMISRRLAMTTFIALIIIAAGSLSWNIYSHQSRKMEQASEPARVHALVNVAEAPKTIAVLPFEDLSPEKDQQYFADGVSEEIINYLSQIPDLTVIARTSSFSFKGTTKKIQEIASELGVANILEGSVRKSVDALRITAQLVKAADGSHLWSKTYDKEFNVEEIFSVQKDIAAAVANELKVTFGIEESPDQLGGTVNVDAYDLYLLAKEQSANGDLDLALNNLEAAIDLDPEFALAWVFRADYLLFSGELDESLKSAQKAVELEPNLVEAYTGLAGIWFEKGEYIKAGLAFQKASELTTKPLGTIPYYMGRLRELGYLERSRGVIEAALITDPLNTLCLEIATDIYGLLGDSQRAEETYERAKAMNEKNPAWKGFDPIDETITRARLGSGNEVSRDDILSSNPIMVKLKNYIGSPEEGLAELRRLINVDDYQDPISRMNIGMWAAYFGDPEFVITALRSYNHCFWYPSMKQVRQLPRFKELVREYGLVDYWEHFGWPGLCHPTDDGDFECD